MKDGRFVNTQFSEGFGLAEIASHRPGGVGRRRERPDDRRFGRGKHAAAA